MIKNINTLPIYCNNCIYIRRTYNLAGCYCIKLSVLEKLTDVQITALCKLNSFKRTLSDIVWDHYLNS